MTKFLLIHTTLENAFVALASDERVTDKIENNSQKEHGIFLHESIKILLERNNLTPSQVDAVSVSNGPGSYTGIRIGLAAAKGFAFALDKPVIICSTLQALAATAFHISGQAALYIPMIHARQSEYYAGFYNELSEPVQAERLLNSNDELPEVSGKKYFFGPGVKPDLLPSDHAIWLDIHQVTSESYAALTFQKFLNGHVTVAESANPNYLKEAFTTKAKKSI